MGEGGGIFLSRDIRSCFCVRSTMGVGRMMGTGASYKKRTTENGRSLKLRAREAYFT